MYELQATFSAGEFDDEYISAPGFIFDFEELKQLVVVPFIKTVDYKLVLLQDYFTMDPGIRRHRKSYYHGSRAYCRKPANLDAKDTI